MFECFHCGEHEVVWMADFDGEDYGYEGGLVHVLRCLNCGAEITYYIPDEVEENERV